MITKTPDPLLAITVSTTLRSKPLALTQPRKALVELIDAVGGLKSGTERVMSPVVTNGVNEDHLSDSDGEDILTGLQEVNLLEGLAAGAASIPAIISVATHPVIRAHLYRPP